MNELGVVGFGHVGTYIKNMEVSKRFYMGILGFEILYEGYHEHSGNRLCFLKNKDCVVELVQFKIGENRGDGIFDHLTIEVEDIGKAKEYLEGRGIVFESEIQLDPQLGKNGMYYVMFRGPDGEHLQIAQTF